MKKSDISFEAIFKKFFSEKWTGKSHQFCPFHDDKNTPNLEIKNGSAYCWAEKKFYYVNDLLELVDNNGIPKPSIATSRKKVDFSKLFQLVKSNQLSDSVMNLLESRNVLDSVNKLLENGDIGFHDEKLYIPLYKNNKIVGLQKIELAADKGQRYKFEAGSNTKGAIFKINDTGKFIVVVESFIDACSVIEAYPECGVINIFNAEGNKLADIHDENIIIFLDNDEAGRKETNKALKILNYKCKVVDWEGIEDAKDVNDILKSGRSDLIREMIDNAKIVSPSDQTEDDDELDEIDILVDEFNEKYALVKSEGKTELYELEEGQYHLSKIRDMKLWYQNKRIFDGRKMVSKASIWLNHPNRREFKGITFALPGKEPQGKLNLFTGFKVDPKKGDWSLFKQVIYDCLASKDENIYEYIIAWMADAVQNITNKPGVVLAFRGEQGTGKSFFAEHFGYLYGNYFLELSQKTHLLGNFNYHFMNKLLVFVDEAIWGGDKAQSGVLKNYITSRKINIEKKGHDIITVDNFMRFIVASNSSWFVPAGEGERRYCALDVSDIHKEDTNFFHMVADQMKNGGYEAMMYDLIKYDLSSIDIYKFPKTQALIDQILRNMEPFNQFWYWVLDHNSYDEIYFEYKAWNVSDQRNDILKDNLIEPKFNDSTKYYTHNKILSKSYEQFCNDKGIKYKQFDFISDLKRVLHKNKVNEAWRISKGQNPVNVYPIPSLEEARELFETFILGRSVPHWHETTNYGDVCYKCQKKECNCDDPATELEELINKYGKTENEDSDIYDHANAGENMHAA